MNSNFISFTALFNHNFFARFARVSLTIKRAFAILRGEALDLTYLCKHIHRQVIFHTSIHSIVRVLGERASGRIERMFMLG